MYFQNLYGLKGIGEEITSISNPLDFKKDIIVFWDSTLSCVEGPNQTDFKKSLLKYSFTYGIGSPLRTLKNSVLSSWSNPKCHRDGSMTSTPSVTVDSEMSQGSDQCHQPPSVTI